MRLSGLVVTIISACVLLLCLRRACGGGDRAQLRAADQEPGLVHAQQRSRLHGGRQDRSEDVTIDLQGHTFAGTDDASVAFNVFFAGSVTGVVIRNGTIKGVTAGFGAAVLVGDRSLVTLRNLTITENDVGVSVGTFGVARVEDNLISSNGTGVLATPGSAGICSKTTESFGTGAGSTRRTPGAAISAATSSRSTPVQESV